MMLIDNKFDLGQVVFLKTDKEQLPRIVVRFSVSNNYVLYVLASGTNETTHYDIEISETKDVSITLEN